MVDPIPREQLEQDLAQAQDLGRWLSDDERLERQRAEQKALVDQQEQEQHRLKLVALAIVCVAIPPLWPLAFGLTLHLLFPKLSAIAVDCWRKCGFAGSAGDRSRCGDHDAAVDADSVNGSENNVMLDAGCNVCIHNFDARACGDTDRERRLFS